MEWRYKILMFLTLLIFCVGSVCATEPNNTTSDSVTVDGGLSPVNPPINNTNNVKNITDKYIGHLMTPEEQFEFMNEIYKNNTALQKSNKQLKKDINNLNDKIELQNKVINSQNNTINILNNRVKALEEDNKYLKVEINELKEDNKRLNAKLDFQLIKISELQADKDKLQADKDKLYEQLLSSPKKEDFNQLKKEIDNKNKQIDKLNNKIKTLNSILSVSKNDVCNSLKALSSTKNIKNIKCGSYTFKLEDYLKIPLIKDGKDRILKFINDNGELPNYVTIAGYKVPKNIYQKLFKL